MPQQQQKNAHDVYHGYDGLAKNPHSTPEMKAFAQDQKAQVDNQWLGQHGAFHNPSTGSSGRDAERVRL